MKHVNHTDPVSSWRRALKIVSTFVLLLSATLIALIFSNVAMAQAGQLDQTFGKGGVFVLPGSNSQAVAVAIGSDGKIIRNINGHCGNAAP